MQVVDKQLIAFADVSKLKETGVESNRFHP